MLISSVSWLQTRGVCSVLIVEAQHSVSFNISTYTRAIRKSLPHGFLYHHLEVEINAQLQSANNNQTLPLQLRVYLFKLWNSVVRLFYLFVQA